MIGSIRVVRASVSRWRADLVVAHETGVTDDVGREDRCEATFRECPPFAAEISERPHATPSNVETSSPTLPEFATLFGLGNRRYR